MISFIYIAELANFFLFEAIASGTGVNLCFESGDEVGKVFKRFILPGEKLKSESFSCLGTDAREHFEGSN